MITTVTPNAAMDRTLVVPNFQLGRRHRASSGTALPGGRGIIVARALRQLGQPVISTGFAGGLNGANIVERLTDEGLLNDFVRIKQPSRTSTAVVDPINGLLTEINEYGPKVEPHELALLLEKLLYLGRASRAMVLAGSLPSGLEPDAYQRMLRQMAASEITTVLLAPDDPEVLAASLTGEPTLTVVTQREAESVLGHEFSQDEDFLAAVDRMARMGGRSCVVTHETGCFARIRTGRAVSYWSVTHDPVEAVSELGGPETFTAGYLVRLLEDRPIKERLQYAVAAALANTRTLAAGTFDLGDVQRSLRDVTVTAVEPAALAADLEAD